MLTLDRQAILAAFNSKFKKNLPSKFLSDCFIIFLCSVGKLDTFFFSYVTFKNVSFLEAF